MTGKTSHAVTRTQEDGATTGRLFVPRLPSPSRPPGPSNRPTRRSDIPAVPASVSRTQEDGAPAASFAPPVTRPHRGPPGPSNRSLPPQRYSGRAGKAGHAVSRTHEDGMYVRRVLPFCQDGRPGGPSGPRGHPSPHLRYLRAPVPPAEQDAAGGLRGAPVRAHPSPWYSSVN